MALPGTLPTRQGRVLLTPFEMPTKINAAHLLTQQMGGERADPTAPIFSKTSGKAPPSVSPDRSEHTRKRGDTELRRV